MLNVNARPTFSRTIFEGTPNSFTAVFRARSATEIAAFDHATVDGQVGLLRDVIVGLDDVTDEAAGSPLPLATALPAALDLVHVRLALYRAFFEGLGDKSLGNFDGPPERGSGAA